MNDYLQDFHKNKEVFLRFRAGKAVKSQAKVATQQLRSKNSLEASGAYTTSKRLKLNEELRLERSELENEVLSEGASFNFPKMHLISHFTEQISKYGSLPQYLTDICEASHKPLKDGYREAITSM